MKNALNEIINSALEACLDWLVEDGNGGARLRDPNDGKVIEGHYGDTHLAAALILLGQLRQENKLTNLGIKIVNSVIDTWPRAKTLPDFHNDFNNFALCLIQERIEAEDPKKAKTIRDIVLATPDTRHNTINWLPMRAYVNHSRYEWTGATGYHDAASQSVKTVEDATNGDGGIEDQLPVGLSYNLQYNLSTLAGMRLLSRKWEVINYPLGRGEAFLLDCTLPDGDINYMGRGANQIFAWGPWLYLLSAKEAPGPLKQALDFLELRYPLAAKTGNLLLNGHPGEEKLFWWDYHYASVYHAHLLLWSVLALSELTNSHHSGETGEDKRNVGANSQKQSTGLKITRTEFGGASTFNGRSMYLAESGPILCALWQSKDAFLFKGGLGPWRGAFGSKYAFADAVFQNHFGLITQDAGGSIFDGRWGRRLFRHRIRDRSAIIRPIFAPMEYEFDETKTRIKLHTDELSGYINLPLMASAANNVEVRFSVDGRCLTAVHMGRVKNHYGLAEVIRSMPGRGKRWDVTITRRQPA